MLKLLRTDIRGLSLFKDSRLTIDFVAEKNVTEEDISDGEIERIDDYIDKFNVVALVGANATGKTTQLKLINMVLGVFLSLDSVSKYQDLFAQFEEKINFKNYFYDKKTIYEVDSYLEKAEDGKYYFVEEVVRSKVIFPSHKKSDLFVFNTTKRNQKVVLVRSKLSKESAAFLRDDYSAFSTIVNTLNGNQKDYVLDEIERTSSNGLSHSEEFPMEFIKYFDPSIESLKVLSESPFTTTVNVELKFKDREPFQVPLIELNNYLSSGTIKGINLFMDIEKTLMNGGYLLIDEIENHLHKSIVMNVISLFSTTININGATLIFSTHYSEIIDILQRTDMVYIATKEQNKMNVQKMSHSLGKEDRNDRKKSEVLLSGKLESTPKYRDLKEVRKRIRKNVQSDHKLSHIGGEA